MGSVDSTSQTTLDAVSNPKKFEELYDLGEKIGAGTYSTVNKCFYKSSSAEFAVKTINKKYLTNRELIAVQKEIKILRRVSHKNIIQLIDAFDDGEKVLIVLELCNGQDLFDKIVCSKNNHFSECKAAQIVYELAVGLKHLHENGIAHRDIKPENCLFIADGTLKITDFGSAHHHKSTSILMHSCCGSPHYVAPEIIANNKYNEKCDIWSLGVILYILLVGYQPFRANSLVQLYKEIKTGKYDLNSKGWINISTQAKHLVACLLQVNPTHRYSAKDIECHPWIIKHTTDSLY